ncbi:MAG TPA: non-canonical purine NTP pyrophosphatase [Candidatus Saccharimonadales bacterium]|nr:non-canonical purine NTP pyrophosphatase [Candidatus Saccharimonadales bacterium]
MDTVYFATSNQEKMLIAQTVCSKFNINVEQASIDIDEIQGEDPVIIVQDKARRAYEGLSKPVVVSDDSWDIPALNGFPGPYMKSINKWFRSDDFLRLMKGINDRSIILHQLLAYYDGSTMKVFSNDIHGKVIDESRGKNDRSPNMTVTVLDHDNGKTIAEVFEQGEKAVVERYLTRSDAWHGLADWFNTETKK